MLFESARWTARPVERQAAQEGLVSAAVTVEKKARAKRRRRSTTSD